MSTHRQPQLRPESELADLARADEVGSVLELGNIFTSSFSGSLARLASPDSYDVSIEVSYSALPAKLLYRFEVTSALTGVRGEEDPENLSERTSGSGRELTGRDSEEFSGDRPRLAELQLTIVAEFNVSKDAQPLSLTEEQIKLFGDTVALRIAFPFIREALSTFYIRLGFPAITAGLIRPGQGVPDRFTAGYRG